MLRKAHMMVEHFMHHTINKSGIKQRLWLSVIQDVQPQIINVYLTDLLQITMMAKSRHWWLSQAKWKIVTDVNAQKRT